MAGLIQNQMAAAGMPQRMPPGAGEPDADNGVGNQMSPGGEPDADEEGGPDADSDPGYAAALKFALGALYKAGAAEGIAKQMETSNNKADAMATIAYELVSMADEKTQGQVPDELLVPLALTVLQELVDIAQAAGVQFADTDVVVALKTMILRFLGEQGVDTTQLEQAMSKAAPEEIVAAAGQGESP